MQDATNPRDAMIEAMVLPDPYAGSTNTWGNLEADTPVPNLHQRYRAILANRDSIMFAMMEEDCKTIGYAETNMNKAVMDGGVQFQKAERVSRLLRFIRDQFDMTPGDEEATAAWDEAFKYALGE